MRQPILADGRKMKLALLFAVLLETAALSAQAVQHDEVQANIHNRLTVWNADLGEAAGSAMLVIRERLLDSQRLAQNRGFVFIGEVSRNDQVRQKRCAARGVEHKVAYRASEVLWNYPGSMVRENYEVSKGFIDCRQAPLPPPFVSGTKVIVYCEAPEMGMGYTCQSPVLFTDNRLKKVQSWIEDLRQREGDPVLLQIHQRLHDSLERAPNHPLLLFGAVSWIEPKPRFLVGTIAMVPRMRASISRVLWGHYKNSEITSDCPSRDCSSLTVGTKVTIYCEDLAPVYATQAPGCNGLVSSAFTDENVRKVETWAEQARQRQPSLILEKISKSLATSQPDENWKPSAYRGYVESIGKADNGVPLERFIDVAGGKKTAVNLEFRFPYPHVPPVDIGKPMITFCYQKEDVCYAGEEALGIIEDSDETFRGIEKLIASALGATAR